MIMRLLMFSGVQMWYDEVNGYNFHSQKCTKFTCLHYTQVRYFILLLFIFNNVFLIKLKLAWAKTDVIGCGIANCSSRRLGSKFLICNYGPGYIKH